MSPELRRHSCRLMMSAEGNLGVLPTDLIFQIFSRLPFKSIAICRCVSKLWASLLGSPNFTELFLTQSATWPRLLFTIQRNNCDWDLYSCPQPQISNKNIEPFLSDEAKEIRLKTLKQLYKEIRPQSLGVADLGCSSGPNVFSTIKDIIKAVDSHHLYILGQSLSSLPEFRIFLNDLPGDNINSIFTALPDFHKELKESTGDGNPSVYISASPGSFYGRLFPDNTLHFIYSSYSLHRLSKVPLAIFDSDGKSINKGCVTICSSSPEPVFIAYYDQFKDDFATFLRCRSKELVSGGKMVLIMLGREGAEEAGHIHRGNSFLWELFSISIANLVAQGQIDEDKFNSYDIPFYAPRALEIENEVEKEGSFQKESLEIIELDKKGKGGQNCTYGKTVANMLRPIEQSICQHFGEEVVDNLFEAYANLVDEESGKTKIKPITFSVILKKL